MLRNVKTAALLGSFVLTLGACEIEFLSDPLSDAEARYDERIVGEWLVVTNVPLEGEAESPENSGEWHPEEESPTTLLIDPDAGLVVLRDSENTQEVTVRFGQVAGMWIVTSEDLEDLVEPAKPAEGEEAEADPQGKPGPLTEIDRRFFILSYRFVDPDFIQLSYADAGYVRERIEDGFTGGTIVPVCLPEDLPDDTPEQTAAQTIEDVVSSLYTSTDCTVVNLTLEGLADLIETNPDDLFTEMEDSRLRRAP